MKLINSTTTTTLFTLFLLSGAITTSHLPSAAADFILDQDGWPLQNGGSYYILPAIGGSGGGGLTLAFTGNETCPVSVVQAPFETARGFPVRISSPFRILSIYEGLILDLSFSEVPECAPTPSRWTVVKGLPEGLSVKLRFYEEDTVGGWFQIAKHGYNGYDYKLMFCAVSSDTCEDIAVQVDENTDRLLVVTDDKSVQPLVVQFRRARRHDHDASADDA